MLIKWAHSVTVNYYHSFGVKKWKGVGVPVECKKKKTHLDLSLSCCCNKIVFTLRQPYTKYFLVLSHYFRFF